MECWEKTTTTKRIPLEVTCGGATEITSVLSWTSALFIRNCLHAHGTPQEAAQWEKRSSSLGVSTTKRLPLPIFSIFHYVVAKCCRARQKENTLGQRGEAP